MRLTRFAVLLILLAIQVIPAFLSAQPHLSGPQSGVLGPGSYLVVGDISVDSGEELNILPGTEFLHNGYFTWNIYGQMIAAGEEGDSISFVSLDSLGGNRWGGLRFEEGSSNQSILDYCIIQHCYREFAYNNYGCAVYLNSVAIPITNTRISYCQTTDGGAGIYARYVTNLVIDKCIITHNINEYDYYGGTIGLEYCENAMMTNCIIAHNQGMYYY